jgi:proline iminopeptidase
MSGPWVELGAGTRASFHTVGSGPPLLWVEGGPGFPAMLGLPDCRAVEDLFRCFLVDAPGSGQSSPPRDVGEYDLAGHVRFFERVRRALDIRSWTVMGHSWGGLVALAYAARCGEVVDRVIVVDGYAGEASVPGEVAAAESARAVARHADQDWFAAATAPWQEVTAATTAEDLMADMAPRYPLYFAFPDQPAQRAHIRRLQRDGRLNPDVWRVWNGDGGLAPSTDLTPELSAVRCRTLVLVGQHDWVCGPAWAEHIAAHVPGATTAVFADSGHCPQYEQPGEFHDTVARWLADETAG